MNLTEIENLPFAELKAQRDILEARIVNDESITKLDIAARYVQARTDAKARDEKLAEQADTLKALQDGIGAAGRERDALKADLEREQAAGDKMSRQLAELENVRAAANQEIVKLREQLAAAQELAKRRRAVLAEIIGKVSPLLADEG